MEEIGSWIAAAVAVLGGVCGILFGWASWRRGEKEGGRSGVKEDGQLMSDIGYIKSGVDDLKRKLERQEETNMEFQSRLSAAEASVKQAHKRIDELMHGTVTK